MNNQPPYQQPLYYYPPQPPKKNNTGWWIALGLAIGIFACVGCAVILPIFNTSRTTTTTSSYTDYSSTPVGAGSSTHVVFYRDTATPQAGINNNPWGYDFDSTGNLIYDPDPDFCNGKYFKCVAGFWDDTRGFVVECNDGLYSHKGGVNVGNGGSCPDDGGEGRTLYWH